MVKEEKLINICIRDSYGFNEIIYPKLNKLIDNVNPSFYNFGTPTSFNIYFKPDFDPGKIEQLIDEAKVLCSEHLDILENPSLSKCSAVFTFETDFRGRIKNIPLGGLDINKIENVIWALS